MMTGSTAMGIALKSVSYSLGFAVSGGVALAALAWFVILLQGGSKRLSKPMHT
jgi:hypothetical protein